jgi:hypothetical protein
MRSINNYLLPGIFFLALSCSKNEDNNPAPPAAPTNAPISGEVILYDEATLAVDKSGMTVSLDSTFPPYKSVTGADGKFFITLIPFGNRTLVFEKAGYGTYKLFNINHAYNNGVGTILTTIPSLGRISTTTVTGLAASVTSGIATISVTTNPAGSNTASKYIRIFLNSRTAVSNTNYQKVLEIAVAQANPFDKTFTKAELNTLGFASGTTVYVRAYGDSYHSNSYDDPVAGRTIFPNLNPATTAAASFIVP